MKKKFLIVLITCGLAATIAACGSDYTSADDEPEGTVEATVNGMDVYYEGYYFHEDDGEGGVYLNFDNSENENDAEIFIGPAETSDGEKLLNGDSISVDAGKVLSSGFIYDADTDLVAASESVSVGITVTYDEDGTTESETLVIEP